MLWKILFSSFSEMEVTVRQGKILSSEFRSFALKRKTNKTFHRFEDLSRAISQISEDLFASLQYDPEGFGEIPVEDFLIALRSPEWIVEIPVNKRDILYLRAKESRIEAVTFQDFVNVVSNVYIHALTQTFLLRIINYYHFPLLLK